MRLPVPGAFVVFLPLDLDESPIRLATPAPTAQIAKLAIAPWAMAVPLDSSVSPFSSLSLLSLPPTLILININMPSDMIRYERLWWPWVFDLEDFFTYESRLPFPEDEDGDLAST
ncbi:hypothetical protein NL676_010525 [Syzygium grande]|nr:hypothetical protein NL676_010525 [Syzygium grande]